MSMAEAVKFVLLGEDRSASSALSKLGDQAGKTAEELARAAREQERAADKAYAGLDRLGTASTRMGLALIGGVGIAGKLAMDWESSWAGVTKTVEGTDKQLRDLEGSLREMARTMPATHTEIAAVAEAAGQLGVATDDVAAFTKTMIDLGETTNLTADEAATSFAQFMNVMGTSTDQVGYLGSALVELGNNGASTEKDILNLAQRVAAAGKAVGMSEADVLGFSAALANVGIEAEAGGTAISKTFRGIDAAVREGGEALELLAQTSGKSAAEFKQAWQEDAAGATEAFIRGLGDLNAAGGDANKVLDDLGFTGERQVDTLMRLALSGQGFSDAMAMAGDAVESTSALTEEAAKRYETSEAKVQIALNNMKDAAIDFGAATLPAIADVSTGIADMARHFGDLPSQTQGAITKTAAVAGALLLVGGGTAKAITGIRDVTTAYSDLITPGSRADGVLRGVGAAAGIAAAGLALISIGGLIAEFNDLKTSAGDAQTMLETMRGTSDLDSMFSDATVGVDSFDSALATLNSTQTTWLGSVQEAVQGLGLMRGNVTEAKEGMALLDQALVNMDPAAAASKFDQIAAAAANHGITVNDLATKYLPQYAAKLQEAARANGQSLTSTEALTAAASSLGAEYAAIPTAVQTAVSAPGTTLSEQQVEELTRALHVVPGLTNAQVLAPGARPSTAEVGQFIRELGHVPGLTQAQVRTLADLYGVNAVRNALASVHNKSVTITTHYRSVYSVSGNGGGPGGRRLAADGMVLDFFAGGGFSENHVAQIAPAGTWRVWAEPETGGESYIPLAPAKRPRSLEIWRETGRRLGVEGFGDGDVRGGIPRRSGVASMSAADLRHLEHAIVRGMASRPVLIDGHPLLKSLRRANQAARG